MVTLASSGGLSSVNRHAAGLHFLNDSEKDPFYGVEHQKLLMRKGDLSDMIRS